MINVFFPYGKLNVFPDFKKKKKRFMKSSLYKIITINHSLLFRLKL